MNRQCGECTKCCYAFPVIELGKLAWEDCEYVTGNGCSIYDQRPTSCRECECAYIQMPARVVVDLRPDKCGIIFERSENVMVGTIVGPITRIVQGQIAAFRAEGFGVMLRVKK